VRLTEQLASLLSAQPHFLPAPGVTGSAAATAAYLADPQLERTLSHFDRLTVALVGIGALHPSRLLGQSGNVFSEEEQHELEALGAVGDICLRFFDRAGVPVRSPFNERVVGMSLQQIQNAPRSVGIAGGASKLDAIRAALEGRLVNVLITDRFTAERLIAGALADPADDAAWELPV
jgi:DNA-binding transcriptional regulator LsrR (DeoR family)